MGRTEVADSQGGQADRRWIVRTRAYYRRLAEDCVRLAQTAKETHRAMLLNMARTWQQLADQVANDHHLMADGQDARSDKHP